MPGLHPEPAADGDAKTARGAGSALAGRLRLRLDGRTITYRGTLRLTTEADGTYVFEAEGDEARGTGHGQATVRLRLVPAEGGTRVGLDVRARVEGRGARLDPSAAERGCAHCSPRRWKPSPGRRAAGRRLRAGRVGRGRGRRGAPGLTGGGAPAAGPEAAGDRERIYRDEVAQVGVAR
ncbi:hypothetical protein SJI45_13780 [Streptomyces sp. S399]|uniref:hypothetical protein n=1 Tax=Streptomyces sp. S399 TaxID=3096009 RepID=UPI002A7F2082|nr:hypothetical protein [Streptomyces sp. S399]WPR51946.1 hypothetical protein SJI45_13780 [Streptomyces sp. S399]